MKKSIRFGEGGLVRCISWLVHPIKPIRSNYPNLLKSHKLDDLVLILESENTIQINSAVSNVYMFLHVYFGDVEFYAVRRYEYLTN